MSQRSELKQLLSALSPTATSILMTRMATYAREIQLDHVSDLLLSPEDHLHKLDQLMVHLELMDTRDRAAFRHYAAEVYCELRKESDAEKLQIAEEQARSAKSAFLDHYKDQIERKAEQRVARRLVRNKLKIEKESEKTLRRAQRLMARQQKLVETVAKHYKQKNPSIPRDLGAFNPSAGARLVLPVRFSPYPRAMVEDVQLPPTPVALPQISVIKHENILNCELFVPRTTNFTLLNHGDTPWPIFYLNGGHQGVAEIGQCTIPSIAPQQTCELEVNFVPMREGMWRQPLTLIDISNGIENPGKGFGGDMFELYLNVTNAQAKQEIEITEELVGQYLRNKSQPQYLMVEDKKPEPVNGPLPLFSEEDIATSFKAGFDMMAAIIITNHYTQTQAAKEWPRVNYKQALPEFKFRFPDEIPVETPRRASLMLKDIVHASSSLGTDVSKEPSFTIAHYRAQKAAEYAAYKARQSTLYQSPDSEDSWSSIDCDSEIGECLSDSSCESDVLTIDYPLDKYCDFYSSIFKVNMEYVDMTGYYASTPIDYQLDMDCDFYPSIFEVNMGSVDMSAYYNSNILNKKMKRKAKRDRYKANKKARRQFKAAVECTDCSEVAPLFDVFEQDETSGLTPLFLDEHYRLGDDFYPYIFEEIEEVDLAGLFEVIEIDERSGLTPLFVDEHYRAGDDFYSYILSAEQSNVDYTPLFIEIVETSGLQALFSEEDFFWTSLKKKDVIDKEVVTMFQEQCIEEKSKLEPLFGYETEFWSLFWEKEWEEKEVVALFAENVITEKSNLHALFSEFVTQSYSKHISESINSKKLIEEDDEIDSDEELPELVSLGEPEEEQNAITTEDEEFVDVQSDEEDDEWEVCSDY